MSLKNAYTFSICAICGTLRPVVANCNAWRLKDSKEIASRKIRAWQEVKKPAGCRTLLERDEDENEVLLVCQRCLDLVSAIDEVDTKLESMLSSLWDRMKRAPSEVHNLGLGDGPIEYEVIYDDGRKEIRRPHEESVTLEVQRRVPAEVVHDVPPKFVLRKSLEAGSDQYEFLRRDEPVSPAKGGTSQVSDDVLPLNRGVFRNATVSESDSCDEGDLVIVEPCEQSKKDRESDAMLLLRLHHDTHKAAGLRARDDSCSLGVEAMDIVRDVEENSLSSGGLHMRKDESSSNSSCGDDSGESTDSGIAQSSAADVGANSDLKGDGERRYRHADAKSRKREQNKEAALRYRLRKKQENERNMVVLRELEGRNRDLRRDLKKAVGMLEGAKMLYRNSEFFSDGNGGGAPNRFLEGKHVFANRALMGRFERDMRCYPKSECV